MNLCIPYTPWLVHPLWIVTWKVGCPCVTLSVSHSPWLWFHTLFRMCTCISSWIYVDLMPMSGPAAMHSLMETWVPLYGSVFVSQVSHFCSHTLFRMCTCISIGIYVHLTPHISSTPMYSYMESWLLLCVCTSHPACGLTPCLECVHASVQEFMSTWLPSSGPALCILWCQVGCPVWQCVCVPVTSFLIPHIV